MNINNDDVKENINLEPIVDNSKWKQLFSTLRTCFLCVSCGNMLGYTSSAIPSMRDDIETFPNLTPYDISWIGGLGPLGALCGGVFTVLPLYYFGSRKTIFYFGAPLFIICWTIISTSYSLWAIWIGRFIGGLGAGIIIACSPLYVIDIASISRRGRLGVIPQGLVLCGILITFILGSFLNWRYTGIVCGCISISSIFLIWFSPDSPKWLISKKFHTQAMSSLKKLHSDDETIRNEFNRLCRELDGTISSGIKNQKLKFNIPQVKACAVALAIVSFQQLTGINGVTFYAVTIFKSTPGIETLGTHLPPIILACVQCISAFTSFLLIEKIGRKYLLLLSSGFLFVTSGIMGFYFYYGIVYENFYWVPLVTLILYMLAFAIGFGPVAWIIVVEILPQQIRNSLNPIIIGYYWFFVFLVTKSFPILILEIYIYGIFWMYSLFAGIAFLFVLFFVPETKGKTSHELQMYFGYIGSDTTNQNLTTNSENIPLDENKLPNL